MKNKEAISLMVNTEGWQILNKWIEEVSDNTILLDVTSWEDYIEKKSTIKAYENILARVKEYLEN